MEPQFQSSFIPKKPAVSIPSAPAAPTHSFNIFSIAATVILVATILAAGGLFAYKQILNGQIDKANADIVAARDAFQPDTIKELIDVSGRLMSAQKLLNSHIALSYMLDNLQSMTFKKIRFNNFNFSSKEGVPTISMDVEGQSYNVLVQQYDIFSQDTSIQNPSFSDFTVTDNGNVTTKFIGTIDPSLISYKKSIEPIESTQSIESATSTNQ